MLGFLLIVLYAVLLAVIFKYTKDSKESINGLIFADKEITSKYLIPSIFNSWLWTTSVIGAAEACILYGKFGGLFFALGTGIGVLAFIPVILRFRRLTGNRIFVTDFIKGRFGEKAEFLFYATSVLLVVYIVIEQAVGMSSLFSVAFGISFKKVAFFTVILAVIFVVFTGMKGVLINDRINFVIIIAGMLILYYAVSYHYYPVESVFSLKGDTALFSGSFRQAAVALTPGIRYGISAMVIGFAQFTLDPIYYLKAYATRDDSVIKRSFFIGGVALWVPFVILSSLFFGYLFLVFQIDMEETANFSLLIAGFILPRYFSVPMQLLFNLVILAVAFTTIINSLMGIFGISVIKIYPQYANKGALEKDKIKYGKLITVLVGISCALIAISLERVSLLSIDIFSGIFFSAPASIFLCGLYGKKDYSRFAVPAFILGISVGFGAWLFIKDTQTNWFYGTLLSFAVPVLFLNAMSFIGGRGAFNFASLKFIKKD